MLSNIFCDIHIENSCDHCKVKGFKKFSLETVRDISDYEGGLIQVKVDDLEDFLNNDESIDYPYYVIYGHRDSSVILLGTFFQYPKAITVFEHLTGWHDPQQVIRFNSQPPLS